MLSLKVSRKEENNLFSVSVSLSLFFLYDALYMDRIISFSSGQSLIFGPYTAVWSVSISLRYNCLLFSYSVHNHILCSFSGFFLSSNVDQEKMMSYPDFSASNHADLLAISAFLLLSSILLIRKCLRSLSKSLSFSIL